MAAVPVGQVRDRQTVREEVQRKGTSLPQSWHAATTFVRPWSLRLRMVAGDLLAIGIVGSPGVPHHEPSSEEFMGVSRTKMSASLAATMKDQ